MNKINPFGIGIDSYNRMDFVLSHLHSTEALEWFSVLGKAWSCCDNISLYKQQLRVLLKTASRAELNAMMDEEELSVWNSLPDLITVYRGCYNFNKDGLSWTLDECIAEGFCYLQRYSHPGETQILLKGIVKKSDVVLKLDRDEEEVICHSVEQVEIIGGAV